MMLFFFRFPQSLSQIMILFFLFINFLFQHDAILVERTSVSNLVLVFQIQIFPFQNINFVFQSPYFFFQLFIFLCQLLTLLIIVHLLEEFQNQILQSLRIFLPRLDQISKNLFHFILVATQILLTLLINNGLLFQFLISLFDF